jgi:hypothetical protein
MHRSVYWLFLLIFTAVALVSCNGSRAPIAFIDPVLAGAVPDSTAWYAAAASKVIVLPEAHAATTLYADIDAMKPRAVLLSPLLGSEIAAILGRDNDTRVAYAGYTTPVAHPRLFSATFSMVGAAELAGTVLASMTARTGTELIYAIFAGYPTEIATRAAESLVQAFGKAGGAEPPRVEILPEPYSQRLADRLKSLDIRAAYVSVPEGMTERWISQAFDSSAFIIAERAFPLHQTATMATVQIIWDMKATLRIVIKRLEEGQNGDIRGVWQATSSKAGP